MKKLNKKLWIIALFLSIMLLMGLAQAELDFRGKIIPQIWRTNPHLIDLMLNVDHRTDNTCYYSQNPVKFTLTNNARSDIILQKDWLIMNADTREIVYPGNITEIHPPIPPTTLVSGASIEWTWDQKRSNGELVPYGRYIGLQVQFSNSFMISKLCGLPPQPPTDG